MISVPATILPCSLRRALGLLLARCLVLAFVLLSRVLCLLLSRASASIRTPSLYLSLSHARALSPPTHPPSQSNGIRASLLLTSCGRGRWKLVHRQLKELARVDAEAMARIGGFQARRI